MSPSQIQVISNNQSIDISDEHTDRKYDAKLKPSNFRLWFPKPKPHLQSTITNASNTGDVAYQPSLNFQANVTRYCVSSAITTQKRHKKE